MGEDRLWMMRPPVALEAQDLERALRFSAPGITGSLGTAVVDLTTLISTCRALKSDPIDGDPVIPAKLRAQVRREIKRGTLAYIDTLARARHGVVDESFLAICRVAAERPMPRAVLHQTSLGKIVSSQAGALTGHAATRQDLWRLANVTIHLHRGVAALRESDFVVDSVLAKMTAASLRRRLRKGLIAYARSALRGDEAAPARIDASRAASIEAMGKRVFADARRLADIEAGVDPPAFSIRLGVSKALKELALDWNSYQKEAQTTDA